MNIFFLLMTMTALTVINYIKSEVPNSVTVVFVILIYSCLSLKIVWGRTVVADKKLLGKKFFGAMALLTSCLCIYLMTVLDLSVGRTVGFEKVEPDFMVFFSIFILSLCIFLKGEHRVR